jgi:shikimate kinase
VNAEFLSSLSQGEGQGKGWLGSQRVVRKDNIILTGFMGTGKSAVGKALATHLGYRLLDTDLLIEQEAGMSIAQIFAKKGEAHFRELEKQTIARACLEKGVVIATGGGAMTNTVNAERLKASGVVICLTASPEIILQRVQGNSDRPLLQGDDPLGKIRALLAARAEAYAQADITVDTSALKVEETVEAVLAAVGTHVGT